MIFVFGSNFLGIHGAGSALAAKRRGFPQGVGVEYDSKSQCYALPTCYAPRKPLDLLRIQCYSDQLIEFAEMHSEIQFQVTRVGCGYAGFLDEIMAITFFSAPPNMQFDTRWQRLMPQGTRFWGTYP